MGDGRHIRAASDKWVHGNTPVPRDHVSLREAASLSVADLINSSTKQWDYGSGEYSTKTGYVIALHLQQNEMYSMTDDQERFFRTIWRLNIMPKWKLFLWKLWQNSLATTDNLENRGLTASANCPICLEDREDPQHLFRFCPLAVEAWDLNLCPLVPLTHPDAAMDFKSWLVHHVLHFAGTQGLQGHTLPVFIGILWAIWKTRNAHIFNASRATLEAFRAFFQEGQNQQLVFSTAISTPTDLLGGQPPGFKMVTFGLFNQAHHTLLICSDGSWDTDSHNGVAAWVADVPLSEYQVSGTQVMRAAQPYKSKHMPVVLVFCGLILMLLKMSWSIRIRKCLSIS